MCSKISSNLVNVANSSSSLNTDGRAKWLSFVKPRLWAISSWMQALLIISGSSSLIITRAEEIAELGSELIDVIATERGLCINPRRADLVEAAKSTSVPILGIHDLKREVERICGGAPQRVKTTDQVVAAIQWVDGTTIDWYDGLEKRGFTFENPNAVKTCGCGSSFQA